MENGCFYFLCFFVYFEFLGSVFFLLKFVWEKNDVAPPRKTLLGWGDFAGRENERPGAF